MTNHSLRLVSALMIAGLISCPSMAQIDPARSADVSAGDSQHVRKSHWSLFKHLGEHILLGVGTYVAVSEVSRAGGDRTPYWPGLLATALVAALKEGTDAYNGSDTNLEAAWHAASIVGAAGAVAAVRH